MTSPNYQSPGQNSVQWEPQDIGKFNLYLTSVVNKGYIYYVHHSYSLGLQILTYCII